jgi:hypothetical protein
MEMEHAVSSLAIDLTRLHRRTVSSSFYSNLVTRPTGQAVRMGVESQLMELDGGSGICLSVLDFSQVLVLDYSCADEIVAKLLLRYATGDRPADAYFMARGLQDHHREAIEAVLERHDLRLVIHDRPGDPQLLGPSDPVERACWAALARAGRGGAAEVAERTGLAAAAAVGALTRMVAHRVVVPLRSGAFCTLAALATP